MTNHISPALSKLTEEDYGYKYKLTFSDGRTSIHTGHEELEVECPSWKDKKRYLKVVDLHIHKQLAYFGKSYYLGLPGPVEFSTKAYSIAPYILGVLLGDGCLTSRTLVVTSADPEVLEHCHRYLDPSICINKNSDPLTYSFVRLDKRRKPTLYKQAVIDLGLNITSERKFIPDVYLKGSIEQRQNLLQGLMDTDGTIDVQGTSSFSSSSFLLAQGVQTLARGLGMLASLSEKQPFFSYLGERKKGLLSYRVNLRTKYPRSLFKLSRKLIRAPEKNQYSDVLKLRIESVERL